MPSGSCRSIYNGIWWVRRGQAQAGFNKGDLASINFPLPPFPEQRRIVARVDELMAACDRLEASLATGDDTRHRLLDALLAEALAPAERDLVAAE